MEGLRLNSNRTAELDDGAGVPVSNDTVALVVLVLNRNLTLGGLGVTVGGVEDGSTAENVSDAKVADSSAGKGCFSHDVVHSVFCVSVSLYN